LHRIPVFPFPTAKSGDIIRREEDPMNIITAVKPRRDRLLQERVHDPYKTRRKLTEPTVCPACSAVFHDGRWQWRKPLPRGARQEICQACRRVKDRLPAGVITLTGAFLRPHKEEIVGLARRQEALENLEHPLHRIMGLEQRRESLVIETTDIHLPRRIGEALRRSFKGALTLSYVQGGGSVRVAWSREQ
jgi:hypothetical protein